MKYSFASLLAAAGLLGQGLAAPAQTNSAAAGAPGPPRRPLLGPQELRLPAGAPAVGAAPRASSTSGPVQEAWAARFGQLSNSYDVATASAVDAAGNAYGTSQGVATGDDYATVKYSPSGAQLWAARYTGEVVAFADRAVDVAVDAAGNVFVTGSVSGGFVQRNGDYATLKYTAAGALAWASRFSGPSNSEDGAAALALDAAGNAYVTGTLRHLPTSTFDYVTIKYAALDGRSVWSAFFDGGNSVDQAVALALDAAGNAYVTGYAAGSRTGTSVDYATVKYAAANGQQLWSALYDGPRLASADYAAAVVVDATGNVYVAGTSSSASASEATEMATVKYAQPSGAGAAATAAAPVGAPAVAAAAGGGGRALAVYPNPAAAQATVSFVAPRDGAAQVVVFNALGQRVATLYEGAVRGGQRYALALPSQHLAPGPYECWLTVNGQGERVRLVVAR